MRDEAPDRPFVTVVMPVRNEAAFLSRSVGSVLAQDYPADRMEILIAEGGSTDGTREQLQELEREHPRLHVVDNPRGIVATGLNAALRRATGRIVVRVDGHCEIAPDYVTRCVAHLLAGEADGVGGPAGDRRGDPPVTGHRRRDELRFGVGGSAFRTVKDRTTFVDTVAFPAYTREILERRRAVRRGARAESGRRVQLSPSRASGAGSSWRRTSVPLLQPQLSRGPSGVSTSSTGSGRCGSFRSTLPR